MKFKKGDRVRCIDNSPHASGRNKAGLELGKVYTVEKMYSQESLYLLEDAEKTGLSSKYGWQDKRFELYTGQEETLEDDADEFF